MIENYKEQERKKLIVIPFELLSEQDKKKFFKKFF